ncbi:hypothetical protein SpCBS45565_g03864 [Spizellomyces sp. 'palustris']|nr:hypothetical protein SpCBS45565_g03864 [Spizellomyces sp. 'palustris']
MRPLWFPLRASHLRYSEIGHLRRALPTVCCARPSHAHFFSEAGPSQENLKVVPFRLTAAEAEEAFRKYHEGWLTTPKRLRGLKVERLLLPFWVVRMQLRVYLVTAHLGFHYWTTEYDHYHKRYNRVRKVRWEPRSFDHTNLHTRSLSGTEPLAQVYASYRFRREYVDGVRSPSLWREAIPFRQYRAPPDVGLDAFQMRPATAVERVRESIRREEELLAEEFLKKSTGADEVRGVRLEFELEPIEGRGGGPEVVPIFLSCYVFSAEYHGTILRTFVNGVTGETGGQKLPDPTRIGLIAGAGATLVALITGAFWTASGLWWWFVLPALVGMIGARYWPILLSTIYETRRRVDEQRESWTGAAGWDPEADAQRTNQRRQDQGTYKTTDEQPGARPFGSWWEELRRRAEEAARQGDTAGGQTRQQQGRQQQYQYSERREEGHTRARASNDPLGLYATLGIKSNATKEEIQAAFRGLAMKHHPDRVTDPAEKNRAKEQFQKLVEAYTILRDRKCTGFHSVSDE